MLTPEAFFLTDVTDVVIVVTDVVAVTDFVVVVMYIKIKHK
jgi:hypothetical protein